MQHQPLAEYQVVSLAVNLPGPLTAAELLKLGASVTKVEPPSGDPMAQFAPAFYGSLTAGQQVLNIDLKSESGLAQLRGLLEQTDLLLTSSRPAALARLGLAWDDLHARYPRLLQVAIVGFPHPRQNEPGHDLTYQAGMGLLDPPHLPKALIADVGGAQSAVVAAMGLLLARERGQGTGYVEISLADAANYFAEPLRHGLTAESGVLGGGFAGYQLYETADGWIAVAALEPAFWVGLQRELAIDDATQETLQTVFRTQTAAEWAEWANEHDLPIAVVQGTACDRSCHG
ncbi:MAG: CoA transferase [Planctomycetaceae bacterium]|nr:CoA transferase [Planctomycetaceae bacterium]